MGDKILRYGLDCTHNINVIGRTNFYKLSLKTLASQLPRLLLLLAIWFIDIDIEFGDLAPGDSKLSKSIFRSFTPLQVLPSYKINNMLFKTVLLFYLSKLYKTEQNNVY